MQKNYPGIQIKWPQKIFSNEGRTGALLASNFKNRLCSVHVACLRKCCNKTFNYFFVFLVRIHSRHLNSKNFYFSIIIKSFYVGKFVVSINFSLWEWKLYIKMNIIFFVDSIFLITIHNLINYLIYTKYN